MAAVALAFIVIDEIIPDEVLDGHEQPTLNANENRLVDNTTSLASNPDKPTIQYNGTAYVWHLIKDKDGTPSFDTLVPTSWQIKQDKKGENYTVGPDNLLIKTIKTGTFSYNKDPEMRRMAEQAGIDSGRALPKIHQLIQEDLTPVFAAKGYKVVDFIEMPEQAKPIQEFMNQLVDFYTIDNSKYDKTVRFYGINLSNSQGKPAFASILLSVMENSGLQIWQYASTLLEVDAQTFDKAREQLLYSTANSKARPENIEKNNQMIMANNQRDMAAIQQSNANFQAKEAARWRQFNEHQRAHSERVNNFYDNSMTNFRERMDAMDANQRSFINTIREEQDMLNPHTGESMKVEAGHENYWYNPYNNQVMPSDSSTYDPNLDPNVNQHDWQLLQKSGQR